MKMQYFFRSIVLLMFITFISCSENDNAPLLPVATPVLVDKITSTVYYGNESETSVHNYTYIGNVLTKVSSGPYRQEFIYDNTKIIEVKLYSNDILAKTSTLIYNGDHMATTITSGDYSEKADYNYNNNLSSITFSNFSNAQWFNYQTNNYTFTVENNISTKLKTVAQANSSRSEFTYDTANNPMRDMNKYYRLVTEFEGFDPKNNNNPLTQTSFSPAESSIAVTYYYEYTYNENQFPVQIRRKSADGSLISTIEIVYK